MEIYSESQGGFANDFISNTFKRLSLFLLTAIKGLKGFKHENTLENEFDKEYLLIVGSPAVFHLMYFHL
ncbi:MAG: hypothetical protein GXO89_06365, partial [Chlorobi bacterium]|nr:hypothetical protein [Chlorobiota bacterium]